MNNKYIVSIEMIQDDECPIKGVINKIDDNKVIVSKLTEYGEDDGEAILKKENIDTISFLGVDEEDIQLLTNNIRSQKILIEQEKKYAKEEFLRKNKADITNKL